MPFSKPLKVFLSYSHLDNEYLDPFRRHLKSLADDGILERAWTDRDITAGLNWDREIHHNLETCHLFIALTSAAFNSSTYIEGVEMKRALERHSTRECRIIPVYLKPWRVPKRLSNSLQFVPNVTNAVSTAPNLDNAILQVIEAVERCADEMLRDKWQPATADGFEGASSTPILPPEFQRIRRRLPYERDIRRYSRALIEIRQLLLANLESLEQPLLRSFFEKWCTAPWVELGWAPGEEVWTQTKAQELLADLGRIDPVDPK